MVTTAVAATALFHQLSIFHSSLHPPKRTTSTTITSAARIKGAVAITPAQKQREALFLLFEEASNRCLNAPMQQGVEEFLEELHSSIEDYHIGTVVKGTVFMTERKGALVDIHAKAAAFLPVEEACIPHIKHVSEAGIYPGFTDEFIIIDKYKDGRFKLSRKLIQYDLAWERCRQLQTEDVVVKGKVIGTNRGGVETIVEGLHGFVPFSEISTKSEAEDLIDKELPLKFVEVSEEQCRLILSNRKAMTNSQDQLGIGTVVLGTVHSLMPFGAFIDIDGIIGLLHISQFSHDRVSDLATILQPGDTLKVMILSHDPERGRLSLSTKKLEPTPGDMIRNPKLVFEKADEMAQAFRQRIAQAEAMDMLRFQPESGMSSNSEGVLVPHTTDLPVEGLGVMT